MPTFSPEQAILLAQENLHHLCTSPFVIPGFLWAKGCPGHLVFLPEQLHSLLLAAFWYGGNLGVHREQGKAGWIMLVIKISFHALQPGTFVSWDTEAAGYWGTRWLGDPLN